MVGIYKITNVTNNKCYIGKTNKDFNIRWKNHINALNKNCHTNKHLQNAWNKNLEDNFKFEIIESFNNIEMEKLDERERYWINYYKSYNPLYGYNKTFGGDGGKPTPEIIKKISNTRKGQKGTPHTINSKLKIGAAQKGKILSIETRNKISISLKNKHLHPHNYIYIDKQKLLKYIFDGLEIKDIAKEFNVNVCIIKDRIKKYFKKTLTEIRLQNNINVNKKQKCNFIYIDKDELLNYVKLGLSLSKIAKKFNVNKGTIENKLKLCFNKSITELRREINE